MTSEHVSVGQFGDSNSDFNVALSGYQVLYQLTYLLLSLGSVLKLNTEIGPSNISMKINIFIY